MSNFSYSDTIPFSTTIPFGSAGFWSCQNPYNLDLIRADWLEWNWNDINTAFWKAAMSYIWAAYSFYNKYLLNIWHVSFTKGYIYIIWISFEPIGSNYIFLFRSIEIDPIKRAFNIPSFCCRGGSKFEQNKYTMSRNGSETISSMRV